MKITVTLKVDVDLDAWMTEYGHGSAASALVEALGDLRHPDYYLNDTKWNGLIAKVEDVKAVVDLGQM